jgi:hypothetical protein
MRLYVGFLSFNTAVTLAAVAVSVVTRAGENDVLGVVEKWFNTVTSGDAVHWAGSGFHSRPCRTLDNASMCRP